MEFEIKELKDVIKYNSKTGELSWKKTVNPRAKNGKKINNTSTGGYITFQYLGKKYYGHRVAYCIYHGAEPSGHIDHINGVRSDNRIANLRDVTKLENHKNMKKPITNTSGVIGVHWCNYSSRWIAKIKIEQKSINLGKFTEFSEAVNARKNAEVLYGFHENHGRE